MAAEKPAEPDRGAVSGTVLSYRAVVHIVSHQGAPIRPDHSERLDRGLADELWDDRRLRGRLDQEARESFGSEFRIHLLDASIGSSVELVFALYAISRVPVAVAVFRERVVHFSEVIREAIHATIDGGPYDVTVDMEQEEEVFPEAAQPPPSAWDRASAVLAALAGGIGVLGFVTFVGGAIEFARLRKAGLPAEQALAVIPSANLIAIGAVVLAPALVLALVAAVALYGWDTVLYYRIRARVSSSRPAVGPRTLLLRAAILAGFVLLLELAKLLGLLGGPFLEGTSDTGAQTYIAFFGLSVLTSGAVFLVALRIREFLWVAATAFIAVGVFVSVLTYEQANHSLEVRPAAAIRHGDVTTGFFIAETSSQVYLGRLKRFTDPVDVRDARILILPKDETSDISIGPLMAPNVARDRARFLAQELCRTRIHKPLPAIARESLRKLTECDRILLRASENPPVTRIRGGPSGLTNDSTPTFKFDSLEPGSTFECELDDDAFARCTSPFTTRQLADGTHTFAVRAIDRSGIADPTSASRRFKVDTSPPKTRIVKQPHRKTHDRTPKFTFSSSERGSTFECELDDDAFARCTSPFTTRQLADGTHTFAVRAIDRSGNSDPAPAKRRFRVR